MFSRGFFRIVTALASSLPPAAGYFLARLLVPFHMYCFPGRRKAVTANISTILNSGKSPRLKGKSINSLTRDVFTSFNYFMFEFFRLSSLSRDDVLRTFDVRGRGNLDLALAKGRGVIMVSWHTGNWEFSGACVAALGYRMNVVAGVQLGEWLTPRVREMKNKFGINVISPDKGYRDLFLALKRNEIVVLLIDGNLYSSGIETRLFGKTTLIPRGPAALAVKTGAPIVPTILGRTGRLKFSVEFRNPIALDGIGRGESEESITEKVAAIQEEAISGHLDQWCIFRKVWP